jgi:Putative adhesin
MKPILLFLFVGIYISSLAQTKEGDAHFASLFAFSAFIQDQKGEGDFHLDKEFKIDPNGRLRLKCSDARVVITGSTTNSAHVKIDRVVESKGIFFGNREFSVEVFESNGNLDIKERSQGIVGMVGYYHVNYTITIEVPEGVSVGVDGDDGVFFLTAINGKVDMNVDDADIQLTKCKGNDFKFRLDDGDIKMDQGRGQLEIEGDDSNIEIRNANFSNLVADVDDGDFIIQTSLANDGRYSINAQDGLISFTVLAGGGTFEVRHDDSRVTAENGFALEEQTENRTRFTLSSGTARVDLRADDARVKLSNL